MISELAATSEVTAAAFNTREGYVAAGTGPMNRSNALSKINGCMPKRMVDAPSQSISTPPKKLAGGAEP
jgi:hypothetical protein